MKKFILLFSTVLFLIVSISFFPSSSAFSQTNPTEKNTLNVKLETDPENPQSGDTTKLKIEFINPQTGQTQQHVDYIVSVQNNGNYLFGPIPLTHTSQGSVSIPTPLGNGKNTILIDIEGILFQPISKEVASFELIIGSTSVEPTNSPSEQKIPDWIKTNAGWWAQNQIDDTTFVSGIQYLIKQGIISVSPSSTTPENTSKDIPKWIKNNADWWSQGLISNDDFLKGITFLVDNGIITV